MFRVSSWGTTNLSITKKYKDLVFSELFQAFQLQQALSSPAIQCILQGKNPGSGGKRPHPKRRIQMA